MKTENFRLPGTPYESPVTGVLEISSEGMICASTEDFNLLDDDYYDNGKFF